MDLQRSADQLSREDRQSLLAHLLHSLDDAPAGVDDTEVAARELDMDAGRVSPLTHEEFVAAVRPQSK